MDELKSVRVRRKLASLDERHGSLDIKVTIYKGIGKRRFAKGFNNGTIVWPESIYDGDYVNNINNAKAETKKILTKQYIDSGSPVPADLDSIIDASFSIEDFVIEDFIRVNTLKERPTGATISIFNSNTGKQVSSNYYVIVQDPWSDTVPAQRSFGFDPYYLSNGSEVYIKWLTESYDKIQYDISGMTASITASGSSASVTKIVVDVSTNNSSKYPDFDLKFDYNGGSQSEIDSAVANVVDTSVEFGFTVNGINYPAEGQNMPSTLTYLMNGGEAYSDLSMKEINTPKNIIKMLEVIPPRSETGELVDKIWTLSDNNEFKYMSDILSDPGLKQKTYLYSDKDEDIIKKLIDNWVKEVPIYKSQAALIGVGLMVCKPSYQSCLFTNYQSPLKPAEPEKKPSVAEDNLAAAAVTNKTKLSVVFPKDAEIKVREDVPAFKIYIGEPPVEEEGSGFEFQDPELSDLSELGPEYTENKYAGSEENNGEQLFTDEEYDKQMAEASRVDPADVQTQTTQTTQTTGDQTTNGGNANETSVNNTTGGKVNVKSTGTYTSELPTESDKGSVSLKPGFNGVPYYQQFDSRWGNVIYGLSQEGAFVEALVAKAVGLVEVNWEGKKYKILCDHSKGNNGFSSIHGGGCGITSTSMIINFWMIKKKTGKYTSPVKIAKLASENGARAKKPPCNGTQPGSGMFKAIKTHFGLNMASVGKADAESLVRKGYPVLFCGSNFSGKNGNGKTGSSYGGHFIVITGYDNGKWRVNDPGRNTTNGIVYFDTFPSGGFWKILPDGVS
jgi:hypothetical protein